ncbi:pol protein [Cucumis melo var. makuwa]|uniref:Pol protein n=1 Tax=Cucumis melo var. makuwa TaxID=1194695 RepID=A0A5A7UHL9_CUCMM|nr:pol protein [Cucumis melo var. makuwa]
MLGVSAGLPRTLRGFTVIWVVVDKLTKSAHFVPGKSTYTASKWAQLYMSEIVRLHGVPVSTVSDRDARFTSKFWKGLQTAMGTSFQATIGMAPFEALDDKCCRSLVCWGEVGEQRLMGPELVESTNKAIQKIRSRMHTAQSRQKSYADVRRKDLEFDVGDKVFLNVAPMRGVLQFEKRGKLSPRFVGPFEILERIGPVAYRLALPPSFSTVHDVFHVSMLRKYVPDPSHVVDYEPLEIDENLSYTVQPVEVLAREVKMLRNREIPLVKVLWRNHRMEEATWEREDDMSRLPSRSRRRRLSIHFPSSRDFASVAFPSPLPSPSSATSSASTFIRRGPVFSRPSSRSHVTGCRRASFIRPRLPTSSRHPPRRSPSSRRRTSNSRGFPILQADPRTLIQTDPIRNRGLTLKFTVPRQVHLGITPFTRVDPLSVDSIEGHNQVSGKGFPTTGPRIEAGNVVIHTGLHVSNMTASCSLCAIGCKEFFTDRHRCRLFALICASFGSTRLIGVSFGITRLIRASFGIMRLICAFYGTTRLLCRVRVWREADRQGARRMREGHMDAFVLSSDHSLVQKVGSLQLSFPWVDSLSVDSIEGHNQVSGKGFPTTGPRIEAGNVVIHKGLHVRDR